MGELSKKGTRWSMDEISTARLMFRDGKRDAEIGEAIGRTARAVSGFLRYERHGRSGVRANLMRHHHGSISKQGPPILDDQRSTLVEQDTAFCAAMIAAGYKPHVVRTPGTVAPRFISMRGKPTLTKGNWWE